MSDYTARTATPAVSDAEAKVPDDYAKFGQHGECVFEFDTLREHLRSQFPPCPNCGCRTSDDADSRDCGCDAGCNDGPEAPGVNVLVSQAREAGRAEGTAALADRIRRELPSRTRSARGAVDQFVYAADVIALLDTPAAATGEDT